MFLKKSECSTGCTAETVDGLVGISNRENVALFAGELLQDFYLGEVNVLEFIGQDESGAGPLLSQKVGVLVQQGVSVGDHVAKGAKVIFLQHALDGGEDAGDLLAPSDNFFV